MADSIKPDLPVFIGQAGPLNGVRWEIAKEFTIGREFGCDILISDRQVSRYHARLTPKEEGVLLEDLGSKNGTYQNGKIIAEPIYLQDGDLIQIALVQAFVYLSSDSTMPLEAAPLPQQDGGRLYLDSKSRRIWIDRTEVLPPLSVQQFRLLEQLYRNPGRVVARADLIQAAWGEEDAVGVSEQAMDALVRRLRERLTALDPKTTFIITIRGHGLRLDNPHE